MLAELFFQELPPHARRIPPGTIPARLRFGTTSACAENTIPGPPHPSQARNYLRVRGEYHSTTVCQKMKWELPPRARRIRGRRVSAPAPEGTTSACAENTCECVPCEPNHGNYLRVRGEYPRRKNRGLFFVELPPRARRILFEAPEWDSRRGTTSACAENTLPLCAPGLPLWNYLRVRGEYAASPACQAVSQELPPRARRILFCPLHTCFHGGTTSACAENTRLGGGVCAFDRNYLRVRGEYHLLVYYTYFGVELPPRARRILPRTQTRRRPHGTTSACAENTRSGLEVDGG